MELETQDFPVPFPGLNLNAVPAASLYLLLGHPGVGKSVLASTLAAHALRLHHYAIFVTFDSKSDDIKRSVSGFLKADLGSRLFVLDFFARKPSSISDVSIEMNQAIRGIRNHAWLFLDSLSTLGTILKPDLLPPWILDLRSKLKLPQLITFLIYDTGINPPALTANLQVLCDGTLEMKVEEDPSGEIRRFFRIYSLRNAQHTTRWFSFDIGNEGVRFPFLK